MPDPNAYTPSYDFSDFEASNPTSPKPGAELDIEFANIAQANGQAIDAIKDIRRSDGALRNGVVGPDQISAALSIGFTAQGQWQPDFNYSGGDGVIYQGIFYKALVDHRSTFENAPTGETTTFWERLFSLAAVNIEDDSISGTKLEAGAVSTRELADGGVSEGKIAASAVSEVKLAASLSDRLAAEFATLAAAQSYAPIAAPDYIRTAGYTTAGDGGGALYKKAASEPSHAGKFSITLGDGVTVVWYELAETTVRPNMLGASVNAGSDQNTALQAMFDMPVRDFYLPEGLWRSDSSLTRSGDTRMRGPGVLDFSNGNGGLLIAGSATQISDLANDVSRLSSTVELVDASTVSARDLICLFNPTDYSWSNHRDYYRQGEFIRVHSKTGNVIRLSGKTYDNYAAADMDVYKISGIKVDIDEIGFIDNASTATPALRIRFGDGVRLGANLRATASTYQALEIDRCYDSVIMAPSVFSNADAFTDKYCLVVANCQRFVIMAAQADGVSHAIAIGGGGDVCAVPTREGKIIGGVLTNASNSTAGDAHGILDYVEYNGCTLMNGAGCGGRNVSFVGCNIYGNDEATGFAVIGGEIIGGFLKFKGCNFISNGTGSTGGAGHVAITAVGPGNAGLGGMEGLKEDLTIVLENNTFDIPGSSTAALYYYDHSQNAASVTIIIDGVTVRGASQVGAVLRTRNFTSQAAIPCDGIVIDRVFGPVDMRLVDAHSSNTGLPMRLMEQTLTDAATCTSGQATASWPGQKPFRYLYPRLPRCVGATIASTDGSAKSAYGGRTLAPAQFSATVSGARMTGIALGGNFTAGDTVQLTGTWAVRDF